MTWLAFVAGAVLTGADLTKAILGRADLRVADLRDAKLVQSYLARTNFTGAALAGADFTKAYFLLTRIEGADLSAARGLDQEQIEESCGNADTKLPAGLTAPSSWPCPPVEERPCFGSSETRRLGGAP